MENMGIRLEAKKKAVPLRLLAEELGISQATLYRRLSKRLTRDDKARFMSAIELLSNNQKPTTQPGVSD